MMKRFLGPLWFIFVSGIGWILDFSIYSGLTLFFDISPGASNFISSTTGATFAFFAFGQSRHANGTKLMLADYAGYIGYQLLSISAFSVLIAFITPVIATYGGTLNAYIAAALTAKIIVTPLNLMTNFIAAKFTLRRRAAHSKVDDSHEF